MGGWLTDVRSSTIALARRIVGGPGIEWTLDRALARLAGRVRVETIVDVGASTGLWTLKAQRHLKASRALLIEAQGEAHEAALRTLSKQRPGVEYVIAAAGDHVGEIHFNADDPFSGAASQTSFGPKDRVVPMTTIDAEVARFDLPSPYLVKLDTHGFEAEILSGARETLRETVALVVEAYNFELRPGVMRFPELCRYLEESGFRCIDLIDPMHRPKDDVLWQMDLVFVPASRPELQDANYA